jgi:hypothetical protein
MILGSLVVELIPELFVELTTAQDEFALKPPQSPAYMNI